MHLAPMKLLLTIIILFALLSTVQAQDQSVNWEYIRKSVSENILNNYKPEKDSVNVACREGCVFVKFSVDSQGKFNLAFSKRTPPFITQALTIAMDSLQQNNAVMIMLKQSQRNVILPFFYGYQLGCKFPKVDERSTSESFYKTYYDVTVDMTHYTDLLWDMLNFTDGRLNTLDCIILEPNGVGAPQGY
jgi:hypothetical protein